MPNDDKKVAIDGNADHNIIIPGNRNTVIIRSSEPSAGEPQSSDSGKREKLSDELAPKKSRLRIARVISLFLVGMFTILLLTWWFLQPHCYIQGQTDEETITKLIQAESQAANTRNMRDIKNIFTSTATITKWNGNEKEVWNDPVVYYSQLFGRYEYKNAQNFNILPVGSGITIDAALYVSGSMGYYREKPNGAWSSYNNLSIPDTVYGSNHWTLRKDNNGCWAIASLATNAGHIPFPP